jgi:hypothetical protein
MEGSGGCLTVAPALRSPGDTASAGVRNEHSCMQEQGATAGMTCPVAGDTMVSLMFSASADL